MVKGMLVRKLEGGKKEKKKKNPNPKTKLNHHSILNANNIKVLSYIRLLPYTEYHYSKGIIVLFQIHQYTQNTSDYIPEHFSTVSQ